MVAMCVTAHIAAKKRCHLISCLNRSCLNMSGYAPAEASDGCEDDCSQRSILDHQGLHDEAACIMSEKCLQLLLIGAQAVSYPLKPLTAVRMTAASAALRTARPAMMRQVRQITVDMRLGLSSCRDVARWVGMRSVVSSCLFGLRFPGGLPDAGCMRRIFSGANVLQRPEQH